MEKGNNKHVMFFFYFQLLLESLKLIKNDVLFYSTLNRVTHNMVPVTEKTPNINQIHEYNYDTKRYITKQLRNLQCVDTVAKSNGCSTSSSKMTSLPISTGSTR